MSLDFVRLVPKRFRGYAWPQGVDGLAYLETLYGVDGFCRGCGYEFGVQSGPLGLERSGLTIKGAWIPHCNPRSVCMDERLAAEVARSFPVELREIAWPRAGGIPAFQLVVPTVGQDWFDPDHLAAGILRTHDDGDPNPGKTCLDCGRWRWYPCSVDEVPPLTPQSAWSEFAVIASPEVFGDGWSVFRHFLYRRDLAELIASASPRDFEVRDVRWAE
jgi:hypothetical protein